MRTTKYHSAKVKVKGYVLLPLQLFTFLFILTACSMTKGIPDDEQLFTGLKKIQYIDERKDSFDSHLETTKEEVEAALITVPNGSLFGSSYYTVPWSWHLWIYNKYSQKNSGFARWMTKTFGKPPVLMSQVNPALHASVAKSVLRNNGYFRADVTYDIIPQKNPKKSKIAYSVRLDSLFTLDSVAYVGFPDSLQQLIDSTTSSALIRSGDAFAMSALDAERSRISTLFRNNGYYYYNTSYASYLADTLLTPDKAQLRFQLAHGLPEGALDKWYIGNINVNFRKTAREQLTDSIKRRNLTIHFNGKKSPIRPPVVLRNMRLRPRQQFSYDNYLESSSNINATGVFSSTDFQFTPRPGTDTLDLSLNCVFDKPYDFYVETILNGRTNGRKGPEMRIGFTKRNAFKGAEKLDINLHGSYEWQRVEGERINNYQYGADVSLEFPRILVPFYNPERVRRDKDGRPIRRRRFYSTPVTYAKVSTDIIRRPSYYKMHVAGGEWTYRWQPTETSRHEFSPITVKYQFMNSHTEAYEKLVQINPYLDRTMGDYFIPKMRYTYTYTSPQRFRNPIRWETTLEESGNLVSLFDMARGKDFNEKEKTLFKNPYSQFLRFETDFTKTWSLGTEATLVGHLNAGYIWNYGNREEAPYSEEFYIGGANSIRAFPVRGVGPGRFSDFGFRSRQYKQLFYLLRNGDMKLQANFEYRAPIFGNLKGAIFLDAGNVWRLGKDWDLDIPDDFDYTTLSEEEQNALGWAMWLDLMFYEKKNFLNDIALGTGVGLRYDLGFLVIRLDWGFALHIPNIVNNRYFFNADRFSDLHTLHFAIGYPF